MKKLLLIVGKSFSFILANAKIQANPKLFCTFNNDIMTGSLFFQYIKHQIISIRHISSK